MSCRDYEDDLLDLARGLLEGGRSARLSEHVDACPGCSVRLRRETEMSARLRALAGSASALQPSPGVEARLTEEFERRRAAAGLERVSADIPVRTKGEEAPGSRRREWKWWWAAAAAVVLFAGGAAGWRVWLDAPRAREVLARPAVTNQGPGVATGPAGIRGAQESPVEAQAGPPVKRAGVGRRAGGPLSRAAEGANVEFVQWPGAGALPPFESGELIRTELPVDVLPLLGLRSHAAGGTVTADVIVGQDRMPRAVRVVR